MTGKKGLGVHPDIAVHSGLALLNLSWYYNWEFLPSPQLAASIEFVPMVWGENGARDLSFAHVAQPLDCLLGFNEPDNLGQANMTVAQALGFWPVLENAAQRLGSPGAVHADREWMLEFMESVDERRFKVDFICAHWYDLPTPSILLERLHSIYQLFGKPIWLTEFACVDWESEGKPPRFTSAEVVEFLAVVLPELERLPFVERYAWFSGDAEYTTSSLFKVDGSMSIVGEAYSKGFSAN